MSESSSPTPLSRRLNERLLAIAHTVAAEYAEDDNVRGVLLTGSVAASQADVNSDIDLILYLASPVSEAEFERHKRQAIESGGGFYGGSPERGFALYRLVEGVKIDVGFSPIDGTETLLSAVIERHECDDTDRHLVLSGILRGRALHGEALIADWCRRATPFPEPLARKMVETNLRFNSPWVLAGMGAARNDSLFLTELFLEDQKRALSVLCGLNRCYHPGKLKGLRSLLPELPLRPPRLLERFEQVYRLPPNQAVPGHRALIEEIIELIETEMPEIDTEQQRAFRRRSFAITEPTGSERARATGGDRTE